MPGAPVAIALLVAAALAGCVGGDDPVDVTSLAGLVLDVSPEQGPAATEFTFDASDTPGASSLDFAWTFGDGETAEGSVVKHTFRYDNNLYRVVVVASDGVNDVESFVEVPIGSGQNSVPTADVHADRKWIAHGEMLAVHATAADADGDPVAIEWLLTKNMAAGGDGHDHDHGGASGASGFGIPEPTGQSGESAEFSFPGSGTYRIVARAVDPKGGKGEAFVDVKVTQTVPKTTFSYTEEGTLLVGSAGAGASLLLYGLLQPSQNTFVDSARYDFRLLYPGNGNVTLDWSDSPAPADLDVVIQNEAGEEVLALTTMDDPTATVETGEVTLPPGAYVALVTARAGAQVPFELSVSLTLQVPGLNVAEDGHAHEH